MTAVGEGDKLLGCGGLVGIIVILLVIGLIFGDDTETDEGAPPPTTVFVSETLEILTASYSWGPSDDTKALQAVLGVPVDGWYGVETRAAHLAELGKRGLTVGNVPAGPLENDPTACLSVRGDLTGKTNAELQCFIRVPSHEFSFDSLARRRDARLGFDDEDLLSRSELDLGARSVGLIFIRRAVQLHCCGAPFDIDKFRIEIKNSGRLPAHYFMTVRFHLYTTNWAGDDPFADVHYCTATAIGPGTTEIVTFRRMDRPATAVIKVQGYDAAVDGETYSITPAEMVRAWTQYKLDDSAHPNLAGWAEGAAVHSKGRGMAFQNFNSYLKEIQKIYLPEGRDRDPCSRPLDSFLHWSSDYYPPGIRFKEWVAEADGITFISP